MEERAKCLQPIRGNRECQNFVVGGGSFCANHNVPDKPKREKKKSARMASEADANATAVLIGKMEAMLPHLTPVRSNVLFNREAGNTFDRLVSSTQKTWQQRKRHVHQPQLESLVVQLQQQQILSPATDEADREGAVLLELGAGKGLLGRVLGEIHSVPFIAVDRRACGNANYDYDSDNAETGPEALENASAELAAKEAGKEGKEAEKKRAEGEEAEAVEEVAAREGKEYSMRFHMDLADCNLSQVLAQVAERHVRYKTMRRTKRAAAASTAPTNATNVSAGGAAARASDEITATKTTTQVVALAKHLCANATDIALQCVSTAADPIHSVAADGVTEDGVTLHLSSVVFAPCCHPQITWEGYCNTRWLAAHGLDSNDLLVMGRLIAVTKALGRSKMGADRQQEQKSKQGWQVRVAPSVVVCSHWLQV
jgi:hypothetical protein